MITFKQFRESLDRIGKKSTTFKIKSFKITIPKNKKETRIRHTINNEPKD